MDQMVSNYVGLRFTQTGPVFHCRLGPLRAILSVEDNLIREFHDRGLNILDHLKISGPITVEIGIRHTERAVIQCRHVMPVRGQCRDFAAVQRPVSDIRCILRDRPPSIASAL